MSKPVGPYSPVRTAGDLVFCSGQLGLSDGQLVPEFKAQVAQAFDNLKAILAGEGLSLADVVKTNLYLTDMANYAAVNDIYLSYFNDIPQLPARAAVGVAALPLGAEFEIEAVAHVS